MTQDEEAPEFTIASAEDAESALNSADFHEARLAIESTFMPFQRLEELRSNGNGAVRTSVAANPQATPEWLRAFAQERNEWIRAAAAANLAIRSDKDVRMFVTDEDAPITASMVERDPTPLQQFNEFRYRVLKSHSCNLFQTPVDLAEKVERTLPDVV